MVVTIGIAVFGVLVTTTGFLINRTVIKPIDDLGKRVSNCEDKNEEIVNNYKERFDKAHEAMGAIRLQLSEVKHSMATKTDISLLADKILEKLEIYSKDASSLRTDVEVIKMKINE